MGATAAERRDDAERARTGQIVAHAAYVEIVAHSQAAVGHYARLIGDRPGAGERPRLTLVFKMF